MSKTTLQMQRRGQRLECTSPVWAEMLEAFPQGKDLNVVITQARSIPQNGLYWKGLGIAADNLPDSLSGKFPTKEKLHKALLVALGYVETVWTFDGLPVIAADSTAFDNMGMQTFNGYFERARVKLSDWLGWDPWESMMGKMAA